MFANMNANLSRHHEIAFGVITQISLSTTHFAQWAERAECDPDGNYESPCGGEDGQTCLDALVDALRRVLVLEAESGELPESEQELAKREALYIALHAYFGVEMLPSA